MVRAAKFRTHINLFGGLTDYRTNKNIERIESTLKLKQKPILNYMIKNYIGTDEFVKLSRLTNMQAVFKNIVKFFKIIK